MAVDVRFENYICFILTNFETFAQSKIPKVMLWFMAQKKCCVHRCNAQLQVYSCRVITSGQCDVNPGNLFSPCKWCNTIIDGEVYNLVSVTAER